MHKLQAMSVGLALLALLAPLAAHADTKADALLKQVAAKTKATSTLSAQIVMSATGGSMDVKLSGTVALQRPNRARISLIGPMAQTQISDGKTIWMPMPDNQYRQMPAEPKGENIDVSWAIPLRYFFEQSLQLAPGAPAAATTRYRGKERLSGKTYDIVEVSGKEPLPHTIKVYIGPDRLFTRSVVTMERGGQKATFTAILSNVVAGKAIAASTFRYQPPAGAKPWAPPAAPDFNKSLIEAGKSAPEFSLARYGAEGELALKDALAGKKAVLVNFWFYGCGPCREEFPHLQKIYAAMKDQGFELVAINVAGDDEKIVKDYFAKEGFTFPAVKGGEKTPQEYGVQACPTNYLLDGSGNVVWRGVGFNESELRAALEKLGLK